MFASSCSRLIRPLSHIRKVSQTPFFHDAAVASTVSAPTSDPDMKQFSPKIHSVVEEISKMTLVEVADLNILLKRTLNIPDAPIMSGGPTMMAAPTKKEDEEEASVAQTSFTVTLSKFDDGKKVALIKAVKALLPDMNLVKAKKFIESAPVVIKGDLPKAEAEELAKQLQEHGASCDIS